jgi:hypothetical protein
VIWDNDVEVLLFADETACVMHSSVLMRVQPCKNCWHRSEQNEYDMGTSEVLRALSIERKAY